MSKPKLDLESLSIDEMLDLKEALETRLTEIAKSETASMAERLKRLQTYLPDEKPARRRAKKPAKPKAKPRAQSKAAAAGEPNAASKPAPKVVSRAKPKATRKPSKKSKVPAKFRDPETGKTWSGRGMAPVWMRDYEAAGRKRADFAI